MQTYQTGQYRAAEQMALQLIKVNSKQPLFWSVLGAALHAQNRIKESLGPKRQVVALLPQDGKAHYNLANTLNDLGRYAEAQESYLKAIKLAPDFSSSYYNLGNILLGQKKHSEAENCYRKAIALNENYAEALNNLGNVCKATGRFAEAESWLKRSVAADPKYAVAFNNLGNVYKELNRLPDAIQAYATAVTLNPALTDAYSNFILCINYLPGYPSARAMKEAQLFGERVSDRAKNSRCSPRCFDSGARLKVGFVSGDLKNHPVGYFLEGLISHMDRSRFELFAYVTKDDEDELTARMKPYFAQWQIIHGMPDEQAAQCIYKHEIQVLFDLSGHTAYNRLPMFAYRPAPIQITWLGYFATTGVKEMDYIIGSPYSIPPEDEALYTEKVLRLPETTLCFTPPDGEIAVSTLPAIENGFVTFGCFNKLYKLNDEVLEVWARLLDAVPNAKLFLKNEQFADPVIRNEMIKRLTAHGMTSERLIIEGPSPRDAYLKAYDRVDIALDPFPFPGGATSVEGLWMGVPFITLRGTNFIGRQGYAILENTGLGDLVATDHQSYIQKAVGLAGDLEQLRKLRSGMRARLQQSPLFDIKKFTDNFSALLMSVVA